ncbi:MAG: hypothetical protein NVS4B11_15350 [Ktedonobacteraceae bacterium]
MSEILQELGTSAMQEAMEANFAEEMMCFGRVLPGGEVHESPELCWFYTGRPHLNGVTRTHLAHDDKAYSDKKITETLEYFTVRNTPTHWAVSTATYPPDLVTRLQAHGFTKVGEDSNMAIELHSINENIPSPLELAMKEVEDLETLKAYSAISTRGFHTSQDTAQSYYDCYVGNGFGTGKPWHHYLAWLNGTPVAVASLLLHAGIAGIYGVATLPEARKQGIGAALTLHCMREARALGYRIAVLAPSQMGLNMYRKIGFREVGMAYYYLWSPTQK